VQQLQGKLDTFAYQLGQRSAQNNYLSGELEDANVSLQSEVDLLRAQLRERESQLTALLNLPQSNGNGNGNGAGVHQHQSYKDTASVNGSYRENGLN